MAVLRTAWDRSAWRLQGWALGAFALLAVASIAAQNVIWLGIAAWVVAAAARRDWKPSRVPGGWALLGLGAALVVSSFWAGTLNGSWFGLRKVGIMAVFFFTAARVEQPLDARRWLNFFIYSAAVCAAWSVAMHFLGADGGRARSFSGDYMAAGGMYMLALILAVSRLFFARPGNRRTWLLPAAFLGAALLLTYTRSSWIGALAALAILGLAKDWRWPAAGAVVIVAGLWFFPHTPVAQRVFSIQSKYITSNVERRYMWDTGLKLFRDHPLAGYGVDNLSTYYARYVHPEAIEQSPPHVHNTLLQLGLNGGSAAVFFFLAWALILLKNGFRAWGALRHEAPERAGEVLGLTAAWLAFLVNGLFEFNFGTAQVIALVYFLAAILARASTWPADLPDYRLPAKPKFLFLRPRFLGDVLLASAVPRLIKRDFPQARVDLITEPGSLPAASGEPAWDRVWTLPRRGFKAWWQTVLALRREDYDVAADLFGNPRTAQLSRASGARVALGPASRGWGWLYHVRTQADRPGARPAWEAYFDVLRALGLKQLSARPRWEVAPEDERWAAAFLRERRLQTRPVIGVFPGATHPAKRWPLERFLEVAGQCEAKWGAKTVFVFGPLEKELKAEYVRLGSKQRLCAEGLTPGQLAALWQACALVISNDAFPMHVGPAVGTPTLGLFGPGEPAVWFPYAEKNGHRFLHAAPQCWPCHKDVCSDNICWRELTADQVVEAAGTVLGKSKKPGV